MFPLAPLAVALLAQFEPRQPRTYTSPPGRWSLRVEPEERSGTKGAEYVLTGGEREAWRKRQPFALWDAVVTDDGRVAGHAYSEAEIDAANGGSLRVVVLSPAGEVMLDERHERVPRAIGLFAQPELGRFVVRVRDDTWNKLGEQWWAYELATGKALYRERPRQKLAGDEPLVHVYAARAIPGTPLTLIQWRRWARMRKPEEVGVVFQLVDPEWNVVWSLARPHDYEAPGDADAEGRIGEEMRLNGALLATAERRFELRLIAEDARVTFGVERAGEGWTVSELARAPYEAAAPPVIPTRTLVLHARVPLVQPPEPGLEVRDVLALGFDERAHVRFVRHEGIEGAVALVRLDESGVVERVTPVASPRFAGAWFPLSAGRWWVAPPRPELGLGSACVVSEADGGAVPIPGFEVRWVQHVAALGADAFVLLGPWHDASGWREGLLACGLDGAVRWTKSIKGTISDDVCVTSDGRVVLLSSASGTLQVFDATGALVAVAEPWGRESANLCRVSADGEGVLVVDDARTPSIYRLDHEFAVRASLDVHRTGPLLGALRRNTQAAPGGRLWSTDGDQLVRLGEDGGVELTLGRAADDDALAHPGDAYIESRAGRVVVQDQRTRALHVFDGEGRRVTLCRLTADERSKLGSLSEFALTPDGAVYAGQVETDERILRFAPDGTSDGFRRFGLYGIAFAPNGDVLGIHDHMLERRSAHGAPLARIEKRPDGAWFRDIAGLAFAADGAFAVLDHERVDVSGDTRDACVSLFDSEGAPQRVLAVPAGVEAHALAYQGGGVLLEDWQRAWRMDASTGAVVALSIAEPSWSFGLSSDGRELWAVAEDGRSLLRYALEP